MNIDWAVVFATILGPVLAVQAQKYIERTTEKKLRRARIFEALMTNRATRLTDSYVQALNQIDLEFSDAGKDKKVIEKWRALFGELNNAPSETEGGAVQYAWIDRCNEKLMQLLLAMSAALGRTHTEEEIRRGIYYPKGRVDLEQSQLAIIHGLNRIITGDASFPMKITEVSASAETHKLQTTLNEKMLKAYDDDGSLKVRVQSSDAAKER